MYGMVDGGRRGEGVADVSDGLGSGSHRAAAEDVVAPWQAFRFMSVHSLFHTAVCMQGSCANSPHHPLCESFRCREGGNLAPALICLWR